MLRRSMMMFMTFAAAMALSGCYTARTYIINKPRVDQEIPGQPAGTAVKTRKVAVLEIVEKDKARPVASQDEGAAAFVPSPSAQEDDFVLPQSNVLSAKPVEPALVPQDYVVQKDDTLQKIAKKVYGSYSRWTLIYDANREILKDPNFLKPGVTLKIPVLSGNVQPTTQP